jgi:hypothetical protein
MVMLCGFATRVSADTILAPAFPAVEYRATNGANTAGSLAAAAAMGAKGYSNVVPAASFEASTISACHSETAALPPSLQNSTPGTPSLWPSACNPQGMANALNHNPNTQPTPDWVVRQWPGTVQGGASDPGFVSAFSIVLNSFQVHRSPVVVPLWGSADHFATIVQLVLWDTGPNIGAVKLVKWYDGGPPTTDLADSYDAAYNEYAYAGQLASFNPTAFANTYYKVLSAINTSCDPNCTTDPYYHQYVLLYEPPGGTIETPPPAVLVDPPGIVPPHQNQMTPALAQLHVFDALVLAGVDQDQSTWSVISGAVPGAAYEVHGKLPSGLPWNYYLVPMQTRPDAVVGFVQLSTDDGGFQTVYPFTHPVPFSPVSPTKAQDLARGELGTGERLGAGVLTWNPVDVTGFAKSPIRPYYEFPVTSAVSPTKVAKIRVTLDAGMVTRTH